MAVPAPGRYRVVRRSRGLREHVGEVVDSSAISPVRLLMLVRTRCLQRIEDEPKPAPAVEPEPVSEPTLEPEPAPEPEPEPEPKPKPKKWSNKK